MRCRRVNSHFRELGYAGSRSDASSWRDMRCLAHEPSQPRPLYGRTYQVGQRRGTSCDDHLHQSTRHGAAFTLASNRVYGRTHHDQIRGDVARLRVPLQRHRQLRHWVSTVLLIVREMPMPTEGPHAFERIDPTECGFVSRSVAQDGSRIGVDVLHRGRLFEIVRGLGYPVGVSTAQDLLACPRKA